MSEKKKKKKKKKPEKPERLEKPEKKAEVEPGKAKLEKMRELLARVDKAPHGQKAAMLAQAGVSASLATYWRKQLQKA